MDNFYTSNAYKYFSIMITKSILFTRWPLMVCIYNLENNNKINKRLQRGTHN